MVAKYAYPTVVIQELLVGNNFTGVLPDGTETPIAANKGREFYYLAGTVGGRFNAVPMRGSAFQKCYFSGKGSTRVYGMIADRNNVEYKWFDTDLDASLDPESFILDPQQPYIAFPDWSLRIYSVGALTANGRVAVLQGQGWEATPFETSW